MCHAITKSGKRCKVKGGDYFCHIHTPYVEPTIEEQREEMLQKLLNDFNSQEEAWPLFEGIDLTSETLSAIKRAKHVFDLRDEDYDNLISTYLNDDIDSFTKYDLISNTINESSKLNPTNDFLKKLQRMDLRKDIGFLYIKFILSTGRYWSGLFVTRKYYMYSYLPKRETLVNEYRENNLNKLRVNITKKQTPICDDVCNYIIAKYL